MDTKSIRDSRFELLRIVAITFVFLHHSLFGLEYINFYGGIIENPKKIIGVVLNSLFVIGVNLFFLISGYFGIKLKVSKLLKILFLILACCAFEIAFSSGIYRRFVFDSVLHLRTLNSFVPCYISLMLISPFLNRALANLTYRELKIVVLLFTIVSVFIGYVLNYESISSNGYNLVNYIYIYILGHFLKKMPKIKTPVIVAIGLVSYIGLIVWSYNYKDYLSVFAYNNPLVVLLACSFFLLFSLLKIKSNVINTLASSVFAMFLLENYIKSYVYRITDEVVGINILQYLVVDYFVLLVLAFIITFFCNKIMDIITPKLSKIDDKFYIK